MRVCHCGSFPFIYTSLLLAWLSMSVRSLSTRDAQRWISTGWRAFFPSETLCVDTMRLFEPIKYVLSLTLLTKTSSNQKSPMYRHVAYHSASSVTLFQVGMREGKRHHRSLYSGESVFLFKCILCCVFVFINVWSEYSISSFDILSGPRVRRTICVMSGSGCLEVMIRSDLVRW